MADTNPPQPLAAGWDRSHKSYKMAARGSAISRHTDSIKGNPATIQTLVPLKSMFRQSLNCTQIFTKTMLRWWWRQRDDGDDDNDENDDESISWEQAWTVRSFSDRSNTAETNTQMNKNIIPPSASILSVVWIQYEADAAMCSIPAQSSLPANVTGRQLSKFVITHPNAGIELFTKTCDTF